MKTEDVDAKYKTLTERHAAIKAECEKLGAECEKLGAEIERMKAGGDEWPRRFADEQIQFLRRAMTAGDLAADYVGGYHVHDKNTPLLAITGFRKFSTMEARDAFIKSEGGIEVFRAKLAKGWPV